jgi:hypothetical protein
MEELTIGDTNRAGTLQVMDTAWDHNGTLRVTVRDMTYSGQDQTDAMRRLARRCLQHPETIRSSRVIRRFNADGCPYITFAVSRLERN